ncbi:MAG: LacI family DNA-binding transcriptional regulator [Actinomycetota bacterium]
MSRAKINPASQWPTQGHPDELEQAYEPEQGGGSEPTAPRRRGDRVTITQVARASGKSVGTVSKALRGQPGVSTAVREQVREIAEQLGYMPDRAASGLPRGRSMLIGYCLPPQVGTSAMALFMRGMVQSFSAADLDVLLFAADTDPAAEPERVYADLMLRGHVDGFVLSDMLIGDPRPDYLRSRGLPFVCFGIPPEQERDAWVDVDGHAAIGRIVDHLLHVGARRIGFAGWRTHSSVGQTRWSGFHEACAARNLPEPGPLAVETSGGEIDDGVLAWQRLRAERPDAVVTASDNIALGIMEAAADDGLQVGVDLAVTGFDDLPIARHSRPQLTTIRQPLVDIGIEVAQRLIELIDRPNTPIRHHLISPELLIRGSSSLRH